MRSGLLVLLLSFFFGNLEAQNFSNKGKDFWLGYGFHVNMGAGVSGTAVNAQDMVLYFTSDKNANVKVEIPAVGVGVVGVPIKDGLVNRAYKDVSDRAFIDAVTYEQVAM